MKQADYPRHQQAIQADPANAAKLCRLGSLYRKSGLHEKSIQMFTPAIDLDPKRADAYHERGVSYANLELYK